MGDYPAPMALVGRQCPIAEINVAQGDRRDVERPAKTDWLGPSREGGGTLHTTGAEIACGLQRRGQPLGDIGQRHPGAPVLGGVDAAHDAGEGGAGSIQPRPDPARPRRDGRHRANRGPATIGGTVAGEVGKRPVAIPQIDLGEAERNPAANAERVDSAL